MSLSTFTWRLQCCSTFLRPSPPFFLHRGCCGLLTHAHTPWTGLLGSLGEPFLWISPAWSWRILAPELTRNAVLSAPASRTPHPASLLHYPVTTLKRNDAILPLLCFWWLIGFQTPLEYAPAAFCLAQRTVERSRRSMSYWLLCDWLIPAFCSSYRLHGPSSPEELK